jgi:hypothetical protein
LINQLDGAAMNTIRLAIASLALCTASVHAQDCTAPEVPSLPDGGASTMEQMLEGQQAVKTFQEANLEYMNCLDPQISAAAEKAQDEEASDADRAALQQLEEAYNAAVSKEEELAGQFNAEIREYKAANPG